MGLKSQNPLKGLPLVNSLPHVGHTSWEPSHLSDGLKAMDKAFNRRAFGDTAEPNGDTCCSGSLAYCSSGCYGLLGERLRAQPTPGLSGAPNTFPHLAFIMISVTRMLQRTLALAIWTLETLSETLASLWGESKEELNSMA